MKALLLTFLCLAFAAGSAWGQAGAIGIYGDNAGTNCNLNDKYTGLQQYYVVHTNTLGATACQFSAPKPWCLLATYLSDAPIFPVTIGNSQTGVSVGYGACRSGFIHVLTLQFFTQGLSPNCCCYFVQPDPLVPSRRIEVVDCAFQIVYANGGWGYINALPRCVCDLCATGAYSPECGGGWEDCLNPPVPVRESTWGAVKHVYSE
jgi:hypothetical protein